MKKWISVVPSVLLITILLFSCASISNNGRNSFSEDEAVFALKTALNVASIQASDKLRIQLDTMDFIPEKYSEIKNSIDIVPGMSTLTAEFNSSIAEYLKDNLPELTDYIKNIVEMTQFSGPLQMVVVSDESASKELLKTSGKDIKDKLNAIIGKADFSDFGDCIGLYNTYITTQKEKDTAQKLQVTDISSDITEMVFNRFSMLLRSSEELYRTTPNPYADDIAAIVFGIN